MNSKMEIDDFCNRIVRDRTLRLDKTLLTDICEQAKLAVDLAELNQSLQHDIFEMAKEQEAARLALVPDPEARLDGLNADEMSLDEILDNPLSSVPDSGTIVAGGNPECDTQTQKSKQPSSAKAKPPQQ